jgi:hypothetical protein
MGENRYVTYRVPAGAYLTDAAGGRYVAIEPVGGGYAVEHGELVPTEGDDPGRRPTAPPERFDGDRLPAAVQRFCALAAGWLGFDEWEVEQTRELFAGSGGDSR